MRMTPRPLLKQLAPNSAAAEATQAAGPERVVAPGEAHVPGRGIVEALTQTAPGLKQEEKLGLMTEVLALGRFATDASVCGDLVSLLAVARTASEAGTRTR
jgi:hypothetical protein